MATLILSAEEGWEQITPEGLQRAIDGFGDISNVKTAIAQGNIGEVSIMIDENKYPTPYTATDMSFVGDSLWVKSVLTES
jgi:hypothetical protein